MKVIIKMLDLGRRGHWAVCWQHRIWLTTPLCQHLVLQYGVYSSFCHKSLAWMISPLWTKQTTHWLRQQITSCGTHHAYTHTDASYLEYLPSLGAWMRSGLLCAELPIALSLSPVASANVHILCLLKYLFI